MTKSRTRNKNPSKSLPILGLLKEGLHIIGTTANEIVAILRKVTFPSIATIPSGKSSNKYYDQRFSLFSRYDEGIKLDSESWYSVTHEVIAKHIAKSCKNCSVVMDGFAGVGGNVISFAEYCKVIAVDIDPSKLEMLKHNASLYQVSHNIETLQSDFLQLSSANLPPVDVIFASPPWGGPSYLNYHKYDLDSMSPPLDEILKASAKICPNIILYLPKTLDPIDFYKFLIKSGQRYSKIEFQVYFIGKNVKGVGCFLGDIVHPDPLDVQYLKNLII